MFEWKDERRVEGGLTAHDVPLIGQSRYHVKTPPISVPDLSMEKEGTKSTHPLSDDDDQGEQAKEESGSEPPLCGQGRRAVQQGLIAALVVRMISNVDQLRLRD